MCLRAEEGAVIADKTVLKMMREMGIRCGIRRETAYHRYNSYRGVVGRTFENVIARDFDAGAPWRKLGTDVTEFKVAGGKAYWAPTLDFCTKEIVASDISTTPDMAQQVRMLDELLSKIPEGAAPTMHSDRGWQYQHASYTSRLEAAGIVQSMDAPGTIATGTSDALNLEGQLQMIRAFLPDAKTIGILYTTSEPNSVANLEAFQELAPQYGFEVVAQGITSENEVANGAAALVAKGVDCVNNFTDNNVVNNLGVLLHETDAAGIPVFGSEIEQVKNGCVASESLDYVALGVQTGQMAAEILNGADPAGMAVQVIDSSEPCYSQANCDKLGVTVPADYASASNVDTEAE